MTFKNLHDAIQAAFLWHDSHLWEFDHGDKIYGIPFDDDDWGPKVYQARVAKLTKLSDGKVQQFTYLYDMGDNWTHQIEVLELFESPTGARLPRFIDGAHRTPPEDVGGAPGFDMFLEAMQNPMHPEHAQMKDWYGGTFDSDDIDVEIVKIALARLAKRRPRKS